MSRIDMSDTGDVRHDTKDVAAKRAKIKKAMTGLREKTEVSQSRLGPDFKWDRESAYDR
jgi:hypothetical protein